MVPGYEPEGDSGWVGVKGRTRAVMLRERASPTSRHRRNWEGQHEPCWTEQAMAWHCVREVPSCLYTLANVK